MKLGIRTVLFWGFFIFVMPGLYAIITKVTQTDSFGISVVYYKYSWAITPGMPVISAKKNLSTGVIECESIILEVAACEEQAQPKKTPLPTSTFNEVEAEYTQQETKKEAEAKKKAAAASAAQSILLQSKK